MIDWKKVKHFKPSEFACKCCGKVDINEALVIKLDKIRETLGFPLKITSGYRCRLHNQRIGGKSNSAHITGDAVDIDITTDRTRHLFLREAYKEFSRIGINKKFIHVDVKADTDQDVSFMY